jgi:PadR family transcriptional regulator PadR
MYPVLPRLEQESSITCAWRVSENSRRARFHRITAAGRKQLVSEQRHWQQTTETLARFFGLEGRRDEEDQTRGP